MTHVERLAQFVIRVSISDQSAAARDQMKIWRLDALGCAIGALRAEPVQLIQKQIVEFERGGACGLIRDDAHPLLKMSGRDYTKRWPETAAIAKGKRSSVGTTNTSADDQVLEIAIRSARGLRHFVFPNDTTAAEAARRAAQEFGFSNASVALCFGLVLSCNASTQLQPVLRLASYGIHKGSLLFLTAR